MKGYTHVYTGNGKGKTTAAFGLALRAVGAGKKVFFGQFVKGGKYAEIRAVEQFLPGIQVRQFGRDCFIEKEPEQADIDLARAGLEACETILKGGEYDMVVLDEASIAIYFALFTVDELLGVLDKTREGTEVIITGRYAPKELIEYADLVTEMKNVKHYYDNGVEAREGIEY